MHPAKKKKTRLYVWRAFHKVVYIIYLSCVLRRYQMVRQFWSIKWIERNCVLSTNSDFLIPISLNPNVVRPLIFRSNLKYQKCTPLCCKNIGIRTFEFVGKAQLYCIQILQYLGQFWRYKSGRLHCENLKNRRFRYYRCLNWNTAITVFTKNAPQKDDIKVVTEFPCLLGVCY